MKKANGEDGSDSSMDMISELPKEILQRILYFLSQKDAVRTSVLSKSWRHIWCTRPNLHCSDETFKGNKQKILSVVDTTLQRYLDQRLCLDEFHLSISMLDHEGVSLLEKWIPLLTGMGVKDFYLSVRAKPSFHGTINLSVVFKAEPLKLLNLRICNLGQTIPENIPFVRLQVLKLYNVLIENELFDKIISSCPLLADMFFQDCMGLNTIKLEKKLHRYLKRFTFLNSSAQATNECIIEIDAPTLETLETVMIIGSKIQFHGHKFCNLKSLTLNSVEISANSVEQSLLLCIDAPNIEYFDYSGYIIPSISFAPTSGKSNLNLYIRDVDDAQSWFLRLSNLLQALRHSEIHLDIVHLSRNNLPIQEDILVQDIMNGGNRPVMLEHLVFRFGHLSSFPPVFNALFCICRPRNITPRWSLQELNWNKECQLKEFGEFFCKIQKMRESGNQEIWQDLEDLTIEGFDENRREWQPLHITTLSASALRDFKVRLQWSDQDCESTSKLLES